MCIARHLHHDAKGPEQDMTFGLNFQATNRFPDSLFTSMTPLFLLFISECISISGKEVVKMSPSRGQFSTVIFLTVFLPVWVCVKKIFNATLIQMYFPQYII